MLQGANKYIAIAKGTICPAGPINIYFTIKKHQRTEAQAKIYVDLISRDISIAMNNGVIDSELKTNSDYIGDIANWLLYGETNFGSSSIVGLSDEQYASKVTSNAKRIYYSISMTNVVQPESDPDQ